MNKIIISIFCLSFLPFAYAKDLTMTYQQFSNSTSAQTQQFEPYTNIIIEFQKGDRVPLYVSSNFVQTPDTPLYFTVKNNFWLKLPKGGETYFSGDGQHYSKLQNSFNGNLYLVLAANASNPVWGVEFNAAFLPLPPTSKATPVSNYH